MIDNIANLAFLYHFLSEYNTLELPKNIYYMEIEVTWNKDTTLDLKLTWDIYLRNLLNKYLDFFLFSQGNLKTRENIESSTG